MAQGIEEKRYEALMSIVSAIDATPVESVSRGLQDIAIALDGLDRIATALEGLDRIAAALEGQDGVVSALCAVAIAIEKGKR